MYACSLHHACDVRQVDNPAPADPICPFLRVTELWQAQDKGILLKRTGNCRYVLKEQITTTGGCEALFPPAIPRSYLTCSVRFHTVYLYPIHSLSQSHLQIECIEHTTALGFADVSTVDRGPSSPLVITVNVPEFS